MVSLMYILIDVLAYRKAGARPAGLAAWPAQVPMPFAWCCPCGEMEARHRSRPVPVFPLQVQQDAALQLREIQGAAHVANEALSGEIEAQLEEARREVDRLSALLDARATEVWRSAVGGSCCRVYGMAPSAVGLGQGRIT